jgi:hypothetical protein
MHMYEYNESSTRYSRHSSELNTKLQDTVNDHTLALVIYMLSAFNINTIKKTTTFYLFTQHNYDITSTGIYYANRSHSFVLLLTTQEQSRQRKFN